MPEGAGQALSQKAAQHARDRGGNVIKAIALRIHRKRDKGEAGEADDRAKAGWALFYKGAEERGDGQCDEGDADDEGQIIGIHHPITPNGGWP